MTPLPRAAASGIRWPACADEAAVGDRDDLALVGQEVLHVDLARVGHDLGQARGRVLRPDRLDFLLDDRQHAVLVGDDVHQVADRDHQLRVLGHRLVAFQAGELVEPPQIEDRVAWRSLNA